MDPLLTTQVKAIAGKASTAIPAGGVYANDTIARHDPGSLAEDYAELVSCHKKAPAEVAWVVSSRRRRRRQEEQQVAFLYAPSWVRKLEARMRGTSRRLNSSSALVRLSIG